MPCWSTGPGRDSLPACRQSIGCRIACSRSADIPTGRVGCVSTADRFAAGNLSHGSSGATRCEFECDECRSATRRSLFASAVSISRADFAEIPLMEDVELLERLRQVAEPLLLRGTIDGQRTTLAAARRHSSNAAELVDPDLPTRWGHRRSDSGNGIDRTRIEGPCHRIAAWRGDAPVRRPCADSRR